VGTVDDFMAGLDEPAAGAVARVLDRAMAVVPDAVQSTSYGMAALRWKGRPLLGFSVATAHLAVHPFSPAAVDAVRGRLPGFALSKGTVRFTTEAPIPDDVVTALVAARRDEIDR
jgi:uncharacterized protein YdhG (YjbR/CyaY superfamily)